MKEAINIVTVSAYYKTKWCKSFLDGVKSTCIRKKAEINIYFYENNLDEILSKIDKHVILLSCSNALENNFVPIFIQKGLSPIVIRPTNVSGNICCSTVSPDYYNTTVNIVKHMAESGCKRIAFFAFNKDSSQDMIKYSAFKYAADLYGIFTDDECVFVNSGKLEKCCDDISQSIGLFDAVICTNDAAAIVLVRTIKKINPEILDRILIASFGNMELARLAFPNLISAVIDFYEIGSKAAELYFFLAKNPTVGYSSYTVNSELIVPSHKNEVKENISVRKTIDENAKIDFYADDSVVEIFKTENILSLCDELDIEIIKMLFYKRTYEQIAEQLNSSVTTVKNRLKKILSLFCVQTRKELLDIFQNYI